MKERRNGNINLSKYFKWGSSPLPVGFTATPRTAAPLASLKIKYIITKRLHLTYSTVSNMINIPSVRRTSAYSRILLKKYIRKFCLLTYLGLTGSC